jgi:hypothetical protein
LDDDSPYYNIELKELHVAGKPLKLKPKVFDEKHGTVLDSGTTYAYFPEAAFHALKDAVRYHGSNFNLFYHGWSKSRVVALL